MKSRLLKLCALFAACLLVSCIDGREEYWFLANGSGRAELTYTFPALAARLGGGEEAIREKIAAFLKDNPAFSSSSYELTRNGGTLSATVRVEFDSIRDLKKLNASGETSSLSEASRYFTGNIDLAFQGLTLELTRTIQVGKAIPTAAFLPQRELENRRLVYIIHLPTSALETNATRTEDAGKTLIWDIPLADALRSPTVLHAKGRIPLPPWLVITASGVSLAVLGVVMRKMWKKKFNRR
ncbi:MAG: hypothetical protein QM680_11570 [Luteolibacter sp.]